MLPARWPRKDTFQSRHSGQIQHECPLELWITLCSENTALCWVLMLRSVDLCDSRTQQLYMLQFPGRAKHSRQAGSHLKILKVVWTSQSHWDSGNVQTDLFTNSINEWINGSTQGQISSWIILKRLSNKGNMLRYDRKLQKKWLQQLGNKWNTVWPRFLARMGRGYWKNLPFWRIT